VVDLGFAFCPSVSGSRTSVAAERLQRALENFRRAREAAGLPHFDLDCYIANAKVTFSWRALPSSPARGDGSSGAVADPKFRLKD
jgi:hypothetical protein